MRENSDNPKYPSMLREISHYFNDLNDKTVLEVGCDAKGEMITYIADNYKSTEVIGLNPVVQSGRILKNARLVKGDIRDTTFPDNYFDYIFSLAAFEHIFNLDDAIKEMYRIIKPGGLLYTKFGPIWSCCWGHHLWMHHEGSVFNYSNTVLPPYCHLLLSPEELRDSLAEKFSNEITDKIVNYVYFCPDQNRLFYEDYESIINASLFQNLIFYGTVNYPLSAEQRPESYATMLDLLQKKYPGYKKFYYQFIYFLLRK